MTWCDFEKYDTQGLIKYYSREALRDFICFKENIDATLAKLKTKENKTKLDQFNNDEQIEMSERLTEGIFVTIQEMDIMALTITLLDIMRTHDVKLRLQVVRIVEENNWLKFETIRLQTKLGHLEGEVVTANNEKLHYQFLYKMRNVKKFEEQYLGYLMGGEDEDDTDPEEEVPMNVKAVHNLCLDYIREKRFEIALPLIEEHARQRKGEVGEYHNDVATLYCIMAKCYKVQGRLEDAQTLYEKALKIREKVLGKETNGTGIILTNLAHVLYKRENVKGAENYALQALKIREKILGKTHVDVALLHAHLGTYYINLEKWTECIEHYKKAMTIFEQMFDNNDKLMLKSHIHMAEAYVELNQNDKVAELLKNICVSYREKSNIKHPETIFQAAQNCADGVCRVFTIESLFETFGSYENVIDKESLKIMILYFRNINKVVVADTLEEWLNDSVDDEKKELRQTERPSMRRSVIVINRTSFLSELTRKTDKSVSRTISSGSTASKKEKGAIMNFFTKKKVA